MHKVRVIIYVVQINHLTTCQQNKRFSAENSNYPQFIAETTNLAASFDVN